MKKKLICTSTDSQSLCRYWEKKVFWFCFLFLRCGILMFFIGGGEIGGDFWYWEMGMCSIFKLVEAHV